MGVMSGWGAAGDGKRNGDSNPELVRMTKQSLSIEPRSDGKVETEPGPMTDEPEDDGGGWRASKDALHVQYPSDPSPGYRYTLFYLEVTGISLSLGLVVRIVGTPFVIRHLVRCPGSVAW